MLTHTKRKTMTDLSWSNSRLKDLLGHYENGGEVVDRDELSFSAGVMGSMLSQHGTVTVSQLATRYRTQRVAAERLLGEILDSGSLCQIINQAVSDHNGAATDENSEDQYSFEPLYSVESEGGLRLVRHDQLGILEPSMVARLFGLLLKGHREYHKRRGEAAARFHWINDGEVPPPLEWIASGCKDVVASRWDTWRSTKAPVEGKKDISFMAPKRVTESKNAVAQEGSRLVQKKTPTCSPRSPKTAIVELTMGQSSDIGSAVIPSEILQPRGSFTDTETSSAVDRSKRQAPEGSDMKEPLKKKAKYQTFDIKRGSTEQADNAQTRPKLGVQRQNRVGQKLGGQSTLAMWGKKK